MSFLTRMKQRKLIQWALAYVAGAWVVLQVVDVLGDRWGLTPALGRTLDVLLIAGFFVALVLAWYHGEKGRQRVGGVELLVIAAVLAIAGGVLRVLPGESRPEPDATNPILASREPLGPTSLVVPSLRAVLSGNPAVAVLPLENLGTDEDQEFVDGLHGEVLLSLQMIGGLTVLSRTSVLQYRDQDGAGPRPSLPEIAAELGANAIAEGSVSRAGGQIRVIIQLIDGQSDAHLWADRYDRELTAENVFTIRSEIAEAVATALRATLTPDEQRRVARVPTSELSAYELFLEGQRCNECEEGAEALRRALEIDPAYAPAWSQLASNYALRINQRGASTVLADTAMQLVARALELDPELAHGYRAQGLAQYLGWGRTARALELARRGASLAPGGAGAWNSIGNYSAVLGRWPDAVDAYRRNSRLRPLSPGPLSNLAELFTQMGLYERSQELLAEALERSPRHVWSWHQVSYLHTMRGDLVAARAAADSAVAFVRDFTDPPELQWSARLATFEGDWRRAQRDAEQAYELAPTGPIMSRNLHLATTLLGYAHLRQGRSEEAERYFTEALAILEDRLAGGADDPRIRIELAVIRAAQGDIDEAVAQFEAGYDAGFRFIDEVEVDPMFDPMRDHPTLERVLAAMRSDVDDMARQVLEMEAELDGAGIATSSDPR